MNISVSTPLPTLKIDEGAPVLPDTPFRFCAYFVRMYALGLGLMLLLEIGQATCSILLPYAIKEIMDAVAIAQASDADIWTMVRGPLWLFFWFNVGVVVFSRGSGACIVFIGPSLRRMIRRQLFGYLQHHSQRYFLGNFAGSLANRVAEVSMSVAHVTWTVMFDFWPLLITFSVSLILLVRVNVELAGILAVWIAGYITISYLLALRCRLYARAYAAARSQVSGTIVDSVTNIMNAKLFARRDYERSYLNDHLDLEVDAARRTFWFMERIRWFQYLAAMILMVGIVGFALRIWSAGGMTVGEFAMACSLSLLLIEQARGLSRRFLEFFEYIGNINDGVSVIIRSHEVIDAPEAKPLMVDRGRIDFKNVCFNYADGLSIFDDLSISIAAGEKVGLVGFSGSGKSTFVNLILRLFELQAGTIHIDGQDIDRVTQESLRAAISMIPQDPMLFHRTLMNNIRYGRLDATDDEVVTAAKKAHAHDFILQTEHQYESMVGERGVKLSGGQRQRIALSRAILKNAPIVLMDEATSSLDSVTERKIQESLDYLMGDKTVIVIAHRLSTIAHLDRILVFHEGRIIEQGSHDQLLLSNGHYARMWDMQAGGFLPDADDDERSAS